MSFTVIESVVVAVPIRPDASTLYFAAFVIAAAVGLPVIAHVLLIDSPSGNAGETLHDVMGAFVTMARLTELPTVAVKPFA